MNHLWSAFSNKRAISFTMPKKLNESNAMYPGIMHQLCPRSVVKNPRIRYINKILPWNLWVSSHERFYWTGTFCVDLQLYEISVLAVNAIGRGASTMPKEVQTGELPPSTPPQKVQARALNRNSILVRWDPPEKPNGLITVSRHLIVRLTGDFVSDMLAR